MQSAGFLGAYTFVAFLIPLLLVLFLITAIAALFKVIQALNIYINKN